MRKSKFTMVLLLLFGLLAAAEVAAQQQQTAPRKYIIKPLSLGTNTEIRARSTRNLQVQVTDENDRPLPDVPLLFLLGGSGCSGSSVAGTVAGQAARSVTGIGSSAGALAGQTGGSPAQTLAGQTSLRAVTNPYGIANVNFTAPDAVGSSMRLQIRVEGTDTVWQGDLSIARTEAAEVATQQPQTAPRKYIIKPLNLGTNTEIRARSTRNLQVQVTDENDRPIPDVPLLFLLAGIVSGGSSGGALAGQAGNSAAQALAGQTSLRAVTNAQGIANMNFTAPDAAGSSMRLQIRVEGSDAVWQGDLSIARAEAIFESPQNAAPMVSATSLPPLDAEEQACLALVNQFRADNHQPPIKVSVKLTNAAKWLSQDNADNKPDDPDHTDSLGRDAGKRLADFGYAADIIKENIVVGAQSAALAMQVWTASGFHIRNLVNAQVKVIGVSRVCKKGAKLGCHWTVILGSTEDPTLP